jgi:putative serine protease PepD
MTPDSSPSPSLRILWVDPASGEPREHPLRHATRIGSNRTMNDIVLPFAGVARVHAELTPLPGAGWELVAVGDAPVHVDGQLTTRAELHAGSNFSVGVISFTVAASALAGAPSVETKPKIETSTLRPGPVRRTTQPVPVLRPAPAAPAHAAPSRFRLPIAVVLALVAAGLGAYLLLRPRSVSRPQPTKPAPASKTAEAAEPIPTPSAAEPIPTPTPADLFADAKKAVVTVIAKLSFDEGFATGTGFFVTSSGKVLTNYHVVRKTDYQQIVLPGTKKPIDARILAFDEARDLALLQAYVTPPVSVAPLARNAYLKMGDTIFALGSPAGPVLEVSLSRGIISSDRPREFGEIRLIQHDASINPGNSGGPLLNDKGNVVGVNVLKIKGMSGLNFAIPIEEVQTFIDATR